MSGLAEATAQLRKKDAERSLVVDELQQLEALIEEGYVGRVAVAVESAKGGAASNFEVSVQGDGRSNPSSASLHMSEEATFVVEKRGVKLEIRAKCEQVSENEESQQVRTMVAVLDCSALPEDTYLRTELDASDENGVVGTLGIKASFTAFSDLEASKKAELSTIQEEMQEISTAIKQAKTAQKTKTTTSSKSSKSGHKERKSKKSASSSREEAPPSGGGGGDAKEEAAKGSSLFSLLPSISDVQNGTMAVVGTVLENRAYLLFASAAAVIYLYGENVSV